MRLRSVLFTPGDEERKLRRALESEADAIIADLEDAVAPDRKQAARALTVEMLAAAPPSPVARFVRVNAEPALLEVDLAALEQIEVDAIVLPKATAASARALGGRPVVAVVETAAGLLSTPELAALPGVLALLFGTVDLARDLRLDLPTAEAALVAPASTLVVASAAARIAAPLDGVELALDDPEGLAERARIARSLGFGGKACIHPRQVPVVNAAFSPTEAELERARAIVAAFAAAEAEGRGAIAHGGEMIDRPVAELARRLLAENGG